MREVKGRWRVVPEPEADIAAAGLEAEPWVAGAFLYHQVTTLRW